MMISRTLTSLSSRRADSWRNMFSTITTAPSTMMPKSIAPMESRFAGTWRRSRQMNAKSSESGIVVATINPERTSYRKNISTTSTKHDAAQEIVLHRARGERDQFAAIVERPNLHVLRQHAIVQLRRSWPRTFLQHGLRLLAARHEDHAFDSIVHVCRSRTAPAAARAPITTSPISFTSTGVPLLTATTVRPMSSVVAMRPSPRT